MNLADLTDAQVLAEWHRHGGFVLAYEQADVRTPGTIDPRAILTARRIAEHYGREAWRRRIA